MNRDDIKQYIAKRVAQELKDGDVVNLGIGLPTLIPQYLPEGVDVTLQSENGYLGIGQTPEKEEESPYIVNAGGQKSSILPGGAFFASDMSFGIIRGGHVDVTVLGALQVDVKGNLANWMIPGKLVPGMGGAMDLLVGAKTVIVAMEHMAKGSPKILNECSLPLTAKGQVNLIVTEMGVFEVQKSGLVLKEINPEFTIDDIREATQADFEISINL